MNTWKRRAPAVLAVLLLSVPSAIGVQRAMAPTRGDVAGWLAAAGFELVYLSVAVLVLTSDLRRYAQRVALAAVASAVLLNMVADYAARVPGGLTSAAQAWAQFDGLALALSLVESLPLAGLSYAMAVLLHRLAEQAPPAAPFTVDSGALSLARPAEPTIVAQQIYPMPAQVISKTTKAYQCPACSAPLSLGQYGAAVRHGHCGQCKDAVE